MNAEQLIALFDKGRQDKTIRMAVDYDAGHAYNGWQGPGWDAIHAAQDRGEIPDEEWAAFEEYENEELSEADPGLMCVPELINDLIAFDAGATPGNDRVVADECADDMVSSAEEAAEYLQAFMGQLEEYYGSPEDVARGAKWYRFDLMTAYVRSVQSGKPWPLPPREGRQF